MLTFVGAVILATSVMVSSGERDLSFVNPKFFSPNGEMCFVIRRDPNIGDLESVTPAAFWRRDPVDDWLDEYPLPAVKPGKEPEPLRGALYQRWPSGHQELLAEFALPADPHDGVLVANDGHVVTYARVGCGAKAELLTIRAPDGSVVRKLLVRDLFTNNDQQWLCRGPESDVRWAIHDDFGTPKLRVTMLITDSEWDDAEARHKTVEIDLATGAAPRPDRDLCPTALFVVAEADDGTTPRKSFISIGDSQAFEDAAVIPIASQPLLDRAITRIIPEYPEVAGKARIAGRVLVDVVVGQDGRVEAARFQPLPFGIGEAVKTAIMSWEFAPYRTDEEAVRFSGSFVFRFEIVKMRIVVTTVSCHWSMLER